ncbi:MAG: translation initiation factor IF-2 subunit gamma [Candidatus Altiarchaeota archaeon]|nr:translation initiation factor IF-2 subunit gamma [Candidatus Altiarchaeota archaeon]
MSTKKDAATECGTDKNPKNSSFSQPEVNIGLVGHVDHGKTTLTKSLSGVWTDRHSEEIKRGISIRLGYADCSFYKCPGCDEPGCYGTNAKCPKCGSGAKLLRNVSFVDAPGHETLMATMLSGAALMDGAVLVIAANEKCPQPQTAEHLMALEILGVKNIVIAQNKVDLITKEQAVENFNEIKDFIKETVAENALIIPIAAHHNANIDALIQAIEDRIPTPKRDLSKDPMMYVARSFDVNKPGVQIDRIKGGVLGGSLIQGVFRTGDIIELRPGVKKKNVYSPINSRITSLNVGSVQVDEVRPGGLIAIGTELDPNLAKSDSLSGNIAGTPGKLPPVHDKFRLKVKLFEKLLGSQEDVKIKPLEKGEPLMLSVGSAVTVGVLIDPKKGEMTLKLPVCAEEGGNVAISRRIGARWRLIGYGTIK